jgi:hypothetical protein
VRLEGGADTIVASERFDGLADGPNSHLSRQAEAFADGLVTARMDSWLAEDLIGESNLSGKIGAP